MTADVAVMCEHGSHGWSCEVRVHENGTASTFEVSVSQQEFERYAVPNEDVATLVERSFRFLLEREPKEQILRRFELGVIERYFPEYAAWAVC